MSFHFVGSSAPFDDSQSLLLLTFVVVAVAADLAELLVPVVCALPRRNILSVDGATAAPRAKADANVEPLLVGGIPPQLPPLDMSRKIGRRDGEWCGRIAESSDAAAREVVVKAALVEQRQQVLLLLPICIRGGDRLLADLRNDSMPLMSAKCLSICVCL